MLAVVNSVQRQLEPVGDAQLVEHVVKMILHRLLGNEHLFGDFLIFVALRDQNDNFAFALAQLRPFTGLALAAAWASAGSSGEANCRITAAVVFESSQISPACTFWMLLAMSAAAASLGKKCRNTPVSSLR